MAVKMRPTHRWTKRPRGALLQLDIGLGVGLRSIEGRPRTLAFGQGGVDREIPSFLIFRPYPLPLSGEETMSGG